MLQAGPLVIWKPKECGSKRKYFQVYETIWNGAKLSAVYKPAPRSRLKTKTIFSKHKTKIIQ